MKIKTDFVTNSSSTCFVVMTKGEFTLESFINAVGLDSSSDFTPIFKRLFESLSNRMLPLEYGVKKYSDGSFKDFIESTFSKGTWQRIQDAIDKGFEIYIGDLHSDENAVECFFCTSAFIIESENLIVDATNYGW